MNRLREYRKYVVGLALILVLLSGIKITGFERQGLTLGEAIFRTTVAPLQSGVTAIGREVNDLITSFLTFAQLKSENQQLQAEVDDLTAENNLLKEYRQENARLRKLLDLSEEVSSNYTILAARVIARNPENWFSTLTIDKGSKDGVRKNMPVISNRGVVGRISNVTQNNSEVLLILDREGAVGALVQQTRIPGVVEGLGPGNNMLEMIHLAHDAPVEKNQVIVTSGLGGVFPKGLRVGYVVDVVPEINGLMKRAVVQPFVDFERLEEVAVVTGVNSP